MTLSVVEGHFLITTSASHDPAASTEPPVLIITLRQNMGGLRNLKALGV